MSRVLSPKPVIAFKIEMYFSGCIPNENTTVGCVVTNGNAIDRLMSPTAASHHQVPRPLP